jgi:oligosaccharyl transferase complex subunit OST4
MISDDGLYRMAIFFGSAAMLLIIVYHFLEVNSEDGAITEAKVAAGVSPPLEKTAAAAR